MAETTYEQYHGWIRQAEREAAVNPAGYRRKVGLFAALGYVYVIGLLVLVLAGIAGVLIALYWGGGHGAGGIIKLGIILLIFASAVVSALWVTTEEPEGTPVTAEKFPQLVAEIEDLQRRLETIPIHRTIIVPEFNAFVSQTPRLGVFGWHRNTLGLGLDLMLALSAEEMRSVIAHELGHLSGNHSKFSAWIYRVRRTWSNLFAKFRENQRWGATLINRFFYWYVPRFDAYSFALRRQNEYEADAASAELTSREALGSALMKIRIINAYFRERYWRDFHAEADHHPEPRRMVYAALSEDLRALPLNAEEIEQYREAALAEETDFEDTHPSLSDRLKGLGLEARSFNKAGLDLASSAAVAWLGPELSRLIADYDRTWWQNNASDWTERHRTVQSDAAEMRDLTSQPSESLEQMQHWRLGVLTARYASERDALPIFRAYQVRFPDDFDTAVVIGRFLRNANNPECLAEWSRIPPTYSDFVQVNYEAAQFLETQGRTEEAEHFRAVARGHTEAQSVTATDPLKTPAPTPAIMADLRDGLKQVGGVGAAWLAEKDVTYPSGMPIYVLAFRAKLAHSLRDEDARLNAVLERFSETRTREQDPFCLFVTQVGGRRTGQSAKRVKKFGTRIL